MIDPSDGASLDGIEVDERAPDLEDFRARNRRHVLRRRKATALLLLSLLALAGNTPHRSVSVRVSPLVSLAPASIRVRVTVEPFADQRVLRVDVEGEDFSRASEMPLEGLQAARSRWIDYAGIPAGQYQFMARVGTQAGIVATATQHFIVTGPQ